jgi:hypothetical protein
VEQGEELSERRGATAAATAEEGAAGRGATTGDPARAPADAGWRATAGPRARPLLWAATVLLLVASVPVLLGGGPHFDDFPRCVWPREAGFERYFASNTDPGGAVRAAKHLETGLLWTMCGRAPFGLAVLVPLSLTIAAGHLLAGLLGDLRVRRPWPEIAGAAWLLWPVGGEAAWWPSALHVPFGLVFALVALRLVHRRRWLLVALATVVSIMGLEPAIFALPLAAVLVAAPRDRLRAAATVGSVAVLMLAVYAAFPGDDVRTAQAPVLERVSNLTVDLGWLVRYPVKASGVPAVPLVVAWTLPVGVVVAGLGALAGHRARRWARARPEGGEEGVGGADRWRVLGVAAAALLGLAALANLPMMSTVPRVEAPRTFATTWMVLVALVAWAAGRGAFGRWRWAPAVLGAVAACSALTLAFQASTRAHTTAHEEELAVAIAERTSDGDRVALCDVPVTAVEPALRWTPYSQHSYTADYATLPALIFYAERELASVRGETSGCPEGTFDVRIDVADLDLDAG